MRKRLMFLWLPSVVGLAFVLPATAMASAVHATIRQNYCNGYNPYLKVRATEHGWSGVTDITFSAKVQRQSHSGSWTTIANDPYFHASPYFEDDGSDHSYSASYSYAGGGANYHRVKITVKFWQDQVGLVAQRTLTSVKC